MASLTMFLLAALLCNYARGKCLIDVGTEGDIDQLKHGQAAVIDATAGGYPLKSLKEVPAGDYFVQAMVNVYTQFHRS
ncbi:MAG TPA: hypothetical protein VGL82_06365, partial [Bryobacteraceae bacterium]